MIIKKIKKQILENQIIIYMKGSPELPKCKFSYKAIKFLCACKKHFAYVDILKNFDIRKELPKISNLSTYPQLWINGNLIGGCDIIEKMYNNGKLQIIIKNINEKFLIK